MKDTTISLSSKKVLTQVFTPDVKGYDCDQVDEFLDKVAKDYQAFEGADLRPRGGERPAEEPPRRDP